jgi:hypothetical protein
LISPFEWAAKPSISPVTFSGASHPLSDALFFSDRRNGFRREIHPLQRSGVWSRYTSHQKTNSRPDFPNQPPDSEMRREDSKWRYLFCNVVISSYLERQRQLAASLSVTIEEKAPDGTFVKHVIA